MPLTFGGKTFFVKVLARNVEGGVVWVECASTIKLQRLRQRIADLQRCLPPDSYIIAIFPETAGEKAKKAVKLVDEVWATGKDGAVKQMMFSSVFQKE